MGRRKDEPYWNKVTREVNDMLKCKRCGHMFKGGVSRIKAHVDRKQGQGVRPCSGNPDTVPNNEEVDPINVAGSSNPQGVVNAVNSLQGSIVPAIMGRNNGGTESEISTLNHSIDDLIREEGDVKEQLQFLKSRGKKHKNHVDEWLTDVGKLLLRARLVVELTGISGLEIQDLTKQVQRCKEERPMVLSEELVGSSFEENIKEVWKLLGDDKVSKIGIHGMGGVGKTCLVNHIRDEITRRCGFNFKDVLWVTASQDVSNFGLQNAIAEGIGVKLDKYDERKRVEVLSSKLLKKEKYLFILDNVWNYIDLEKVGIPLEGKGNKLILTSRLKHVCRQMDCHIIAIYPLSYPYEDEGWELFLLKLRFHGTPSTFPPEALEIAKSIVKACECLPLGISVMARTMKGVNDIHCWRHALNRLQNSRMEKEMEEEVFKILKLSYDNLSDDMKECFSSCALFNVIDYGRKELIMKLVEDGLINGMRSLEEIFDEGHTILDKLVDHSLLLGWDDDVDSSQMHGLMREMVCHNILKDRSRYMVKCKKGLEKIPGMQEWTLNLEKASLMGNYITEIPAGTSPRCTKMSTLIFCQNKLNSIPECFFSHMDALTMLDLSYNRLLQSLPNSVANLRSLVSLLLKDCCSLKYVPPLGELQKLSRLVISGTSIEEIPQGLETLINLKWLDLSMNRELKPGFVLPNFGNIQYLDLCSAYVKVRAEDIKGRSMLECFGGCFHDRNNYNDFVRNTLDNDCGPNTYHLCLGIVGNMYFPAVNIEERTKKVSFGDCEELPHLLPKDLTELNIEKNEQWSCLSYALSFKSNGSCHVGVFYHLKSLCIFYCHKMEKLLTPGSLEQLQNLQFLYVSHCKSMKEIFSMSDNDDDSSITLPKLTTLRLYSLPQLKSVCTGIIVCGSSEVLQISDCPSLERHPTVEVFC